MPTVAEVKFAKLQAEAERQVILNDMMKSELVRAEDVDSVVTEMQTAIRTQLLGYPAKVAHLVLGKEDYDEVVRILTKYLYETLAELKGLDYEALKARNKKTAKFYVGTRKKVSKSR